LQGCVIGWRLINSLIRVVVVRRSPTYGELCLNQQIRPTVPFLGDYGWVLERGPGGCLFHLPDVFAGILAAYRAT
jgi:hypothetical protein